MKALLREERFCRLENALASLPEDYREVILLARVRGFSLQETGTMMGRTAEATSMLLVRALRKLRIAFGHTESYTLPPWSVDPDVLDQPDNPEATQEDRP